MVQSEHNVIYRLMESTSLREAQDDLEEVNEWKLIIVDPQKSTSEDQLLDLLCMQLGSYQEGVH